MPPEALSFTDGLLINGVAPDVVATTLAESGLSNTSVAEIVGWWVLGAAGSTEPPPFRFSTSIQANDPNCATDYARSFSHIDWIDGESRVQAGLTPEELGFNARFHSLENEFDAIADQFERLGACSVELRADLRGMARELESKLTALEKKVFELHEDDPSPTRPRQPAPGGFLGTIEVDGKDWFISQVGNDFQLVEYSGSVLTNESPGKLGLVATQFDPTISTPEEVIAVLDAVGDGFATPAISELFVGTNEVTVAEIRRTGSAVRLPGGVALGTVIATMDSGVSFSSLEEATREISEHVVSEVSAETRRGMRTSILADEAVERTGSALLNSGVAAVGADEATADALGAAGFGTVSRLSGASPAVVRAGLEAAGLDSSGADGLIARARVARALRNL